LWDTGFQQAGVPGKMNEMRPKIMTFVLLLLCTPWGFAQEERPAGGVETLERSVRQWVTLRKEWNQVSDEWKAQKELLEDELQMLRRKKAELEEVAARQSENTKDMQSKFEQATREKLTRRKALDRLKAPLLSGEAHLRSCQKNLPPFILRHLAGGMEKLPPAEAEEKDNDQAARLQLLFGLHGQIEQLNAVIHVERAILPDGTGKEREMDVILIGLSQGYALSLDGTMAAVGQMTDQGLQWTWRNELAASIKEALAVYRKEKPAEFIPLPLRIVEGGGLQ